MFLQVGGIVWHRLAFLVGVVFRIETLHFFGYAAVSIAVEVNGNKGDACRGQLLAFRKDGGFGLGFFRGQLFTSHT